MSQVTDRRGPDRQVRYGRIVGLFFLVAGFVAIGLGWNGMARVACPDCQLPYLLSGGAAGVAMVVLGSALLVMAQFRDERMRLADQVRDAVGAMSKTVMGSIRDGGAATNMVVAGKSTYHRPDCRLVEGKAEVDLVPVDVARLQGLSACRVCNPPAPQEARAEEATAGAADDSARPKKTPAKASGPK